MVRPTAERVLSRLWRCCSIGLIATAALAQLILLDPGEPATAALLPAEAMEECLRAALASPLALLPRAPPRSLDTALLDAALQAARDEAAPSDTMARGAAEVDVGVSSTGSVAPSEGILTRLAPGALLRPYFADT